MVAFNRCARPSSLCWLAWTLTTLWSSYPVHALVGPSRTVFQPLHSMAVTVTATTSDEINVRNARTDGDDDDEQKGLLTHKAISNLRFRELQQHLHERGLEGIGTTSQLRSRLRSVVFPGEECVVSDGNGEEDEECGPMGRVSLCCIFVEY